jgi:hypothetical protein
MSGSLRLDAIAHKLHISCMLLGDSGVCVRSHACAWVVVVAVAAVAAVAGCLGGGG